MGLKQHKVGKQLDILKLSFNDEIEVVEALPVLLQTFEDGFQNQNYKFILDMQRIKFPSSSFIAFLIEVTVRARRAGGDLKLINLSPSATNNLVTFSPLSYLAIDGEEANALEDLNALVTKPRETKPVAVKNPIVEENPSRTPPPVPAAEKTTPPPPVSSKKNDPGPVQKIDPDSAFHIKEIEITPMDAAVPRKSAPDAGLLHPSDVVPTPDAGNEEEPPQTKEIKIRPATGSGINPDDSGELILHSQKFQPGDAQFNSGEPEALKKTEIPQVKRIRVKSKIESLYEICDFVTTLAAKVGFSEKEVGKIKVTVYEACINVIEHAYHSDPDEWIVVMVQYDSVDFTITIQDWGESFNFDDTKPYDVNQAVQDRKTGGFGMFIILRSMDEVKYKTDPLNGNRLILRKRIPRKN